jgi:hypothetical protein
MQTGHFTGLPVILPAWLPPLLRRGLGWGPLLI